jgi:phosphoserine phosphatase SerB
MLYKLVAFDLDRTLVKERTINYFAKEFGFEKKLNELRTLWKKNQIKEYQITIELAKFFKGKSLSDVEKVCKTVPLNIRTKEVVDGIKAKGMKTAIISVAYSPIVEFYNKELKVDYIVCPKLLTSNSTFTGEVEFEKYYNEKCELGHSVCKGLALKNIAKKENISMKECVAVGDSLGDLCMLRIAGLSIALQPQEEIKHSVDIVISDLYELLSFL